MATVERPDHRLDAVETSPELVTFRVWPKAGYPVAEPFTVQVRLVPGVWNGHVVTGSVTVVDDPGNRILEALVSGHRDMDIYDDARWLAEGRIR